MSVRLKRRDFLGVACAGAVAMRHGEVPSLDGQEAVRDGPGGRPANLLFLWTDEQRHDTLAVAGNATIQAPHLNRLAQESVVFRRAYVSQPVCTPSRATVMTGLWPHQCGCTANNIPLPSDIPCLKDSRMAGQSEGFGERHPWLSKGMSLSSCSRRRKLPTSALRRL